MRSAARLCLTFAVVVGACASSGRATGDAPDADLDGTPSAWDAGGPDTGAPDAAPPSLEPSAVLSITERDGRLFDAAGREVLLRGINARVRGLFDVTFDDGRLPLIPVEAFGAADCRFLAESLGMNLLRLPVNWSGIEPVRGRYDEDYLYRIGAVVADCAAAGVYTLVDLHQDAYSKEIGQDGAPLWAIVPAPESLLGGPLNDLEARRLSPQVIEAFSSLYDNREGLSDAHAAMAAAVAESIAGLPGVVGLELHNEPVSFQPARLADFHERSGRAVRGAAPQLPIAFEPDAIRNLRDASQVLFPFPLDNAIYAPHVYTGVFSRGRDGWADRDVRALEDSVLAARAEADAHGAALLIGEFGIDPRADTALEWVGRELDLYDRVLASSAFWVYEEYGEGRWGLFDAAGPEEAPERGPLREALARVLAHPFPQAVDARLVSTHWDAETRTLSVELTGAGSGEHWLSVPAMTYPEGARVTCDGAEVEARAGPGRIAVRCAGTSLGLHPR